MGVRISGLKVIPDFHDEKTSHLANYKDYVPVMHPDGTREKFHPSHLMIESYKNWIPQHAIWHQNHGDNSAHISVINNKHDYQIYDKYGKLLDRGQENDLSTAKKVAMKKLSNIKESKTTIDVNEEHVDDVLDHLNYAHKKIMDSDAYSSYSKEIVNRIHSRTRKHLMNDDIHSAKSTLSAHHSEYPDEADEYLEHAFKSAGVENLDDFMKPKTIKESNISIDEEKDPAKFHRMLANKASIEAYENPSVESHTRAYDLNKLAYEKSSDENANKDWHMKSMDHHVKWLSDAAKKDHNRFKDSLKESIDVGDGVHIVDKNSWKIISSHPNRDAASKVIKLGQAIVARKSYVAPSLKENIGSVPKSSSGKSLDIGDGFKVHRHGYDLNGNHSVWVSHNDKNVKKIQTNGNTPTAHSELPGSGKLSNNGADEIKSFYKKYRMKTEQYSVTSPIQPSLKEKIEMVMEGKSDPWNEYLENKDANRHSENTLHMAVNVGNEDDVRDARHILNTHRRVGYLGDENAQARYKLNSKLWPKFHAKFAPK